MDPRFLEIFYCIYFNCNDTVEKVYREAVKRMQKTDPKAKIPSLKQVKAHVDKTTAKAEAIAAETEAANNNQQPAAPETAK